MTCREEVLTALEALHRSDGQVDFTSDDVITQMRRAGTSYPESTIRTHLSAHMLNDGSLVRTARGIFRLARHRDRTQSASDLRTGVERMLGRSRRPPGPNGATQLSAALSVRLT